MPLVQFNYTYSEGDGNVSDYPSGVGEEITLIANLPRVAYNKKWILRTVNATSVEQTVKTDFRWVDLYIPELMSEERIMYSLNSEGATPEPNRALRFYVNKHSMDQRAWEECHLAVTSHPNMNLGTHRLDELKLTLKLKAYNGVAGASAGLIPLYKATVILEYE